MNNRISLNASVNAVLKEHPELLDILIDLGFTPLSNPMMRQTLGHITSLKQGCHMIHLSIETLRQTLINHGYEISEDN